MFIFVKNFVIMKANWKKRMMEMAWHISKWSKDDSTKVGCVITDEENTIKSLGYNGHPRSLNDEVKERNERPLKYMYVVHAEINAIANATRNGVSLKNSIMYCTYFPCNECAKAIINSGIKTLVSYEPDFNNERWGKSFKVSFEMLKECGVNIEIFTDEHDDFYKNLEYFDELIWDYEGSEKGEKTHSTQKDWNQTLITKINQASAKVYKKSMIGGANKIRTGICVFNIICDLEYFFRDKMMLGGRYEVIIDNNMPNNNIVVYNDGRNGYFVPSEEEIKMGIIKKEKKITMY